MGQPAFSVRWRRYWRLFRTEQPRAVQLLVVVLAALLVADLIALGTVNSSTTSNGVASGQGNSNGTGPNGTGSGVSGSTAVSGNGGGPSGGGTATGGSTVSGSLLGGNGGGLASGGGSVNGTVGGTALANLGHGVTSSSIRVVFPWPNVGAVEQAIGLYGSSEDPVLSINAAVDALNAAGGINGRRIDPEIVQFNPLDDAAMRADCLHWTQDEHVFAVVDGSAWHDDHQLCITQENHTPLISSWATVSDWTARGNPNLWWTYPDANTVLDNLVAWASSQHLLAPGIKFGVVAADREGDTLAMAALRRSLKNVGLTPTDTGSMRFDLQSAAQAQAQARDIVTRFNVEGIHTIIPLLPYTDFVYLIEAAQEQSYVPRWLLSDYEAQNQAALGLIDPSVGGPYAKELNDTVNPTFLDLGNCDCPKALPIGYNAFGAQCNANFYKYSGKQWAAEDKQQTGNDWSGYIETTGTAMTWCTNIDLFAAAARAVTPNGLTEAAFDQAMESLLHFPGQLSPDYAFSLTRRSGPHEVRIVKEHVNSDSKCPAKVTGGSQGDCWIIEHDFQEAAHT